VIPSSDRLVAKAVGLLLLLSSSTALAQAAPPPTDPKEMARRQGEEALALHGAGKFAEAYARFETAERIAHSPVFLLWMARSKRALGELGAAKRLYRMVAAESLPADASPNWVQAKKEAEGELAALASRIPSIEVRLAPGAGPGTLSLDGGPIPRDAAVEVDPGEHEIVFSPATGPSSTRRVRVEEGQPTLVVALEAARADRGGEEARGSVVPGAVLLGVGLGSVVAGAITGAYALVLAGQVKEGCEGNRCLATDEGKASDADALARASTGLLIAGGVLGTVGVVLVIVRPGGGDSASTALRVGPTWAGLDVRF
jgi:hypothetical protein